MKLGTIASDIGPVLALLVAALIVSVAMGLQWYVSGSESATEVAYRYTLAIKDKELQLIKSGFEKTAAFYSLMSTAKELGLHGGLSEKALAENDTPWYIKGVNPPLRFEERGFTPLTSDRVPYWIIPSADACGATKERIPYLRVTDLGRNIGLFPKGGGLAESVMDILPSNGKYDQYFNEVNNGNYSLYVSLQVFFMKPGKVMVECGDGCGEIKNLDGTAPAANITSDGIYEYKITRVNLPVFVLNLNLSAIEDSANGDGTNVARLKQVVVSIYNATLDAGGNKLRMAGAQNKLFTGNLNKFQASMQTALDAAGAGKGSKTTIGPLEGAFYRGYDNTVAGIIWSPDGIVTETQDYLGNDKLLTLRSSGVTEEEAKIRYWQMYDKAEEFANASKTLLKNHLLARLDTMTDKTALETAEICDHSLQPPDCQICPSDDLTARYTQADVFSKVKAELDSMAQTYTNADPTFTWTIELPSFVGCADITNKNISACSAVENCTGANFEHYEYKIGRIFNTGQCSGYTYDGPVGDDRSPYKTKCSMIYAHRYVLKNLKILVTIKDEKNKFFDASKNDWDTLKFRFFVFVPLVDDNSCGPASSKHDCDTFTLSDLPSGDVASSTYSSGLTERGQVEFLSSRHFTYHNATWNSSYTHGGVNNVPGYGTDDYSIVRYAYYNTYASEYYYFDGFDYYCEMADYRVSGEFCPSETYTMAAPPTAVQCCDLKFPGSTRAVYNTDVIEPECRVYGDVYLGMNYYRCY